MSDIEMAPPSPQEETLVTRRSRRSTAGNRMEAALAEMALEDQTLSKEEDDVDFHVEKFEEDAFESDFASTDEEAEQAAAGEGEASVAQEEKKARKAAKSRVERATKAAHERHKVTFNPQVSSAGEPSGSGSSPHKIKLRLPKRPRNEDEDGRDSRHESTTRQSQRKHAVLSRSLHHKRMKEKKAAKPRQTSSKVTHTYTQAQLIARALDNEEGNLMQHRNFLAIEEERRKRAKVVRPSVQGEVLRMISRVEQEEIPQPPAELSKPATAATAVQRSTYPYNFASLYGTYANNFSGMATGIVPYNAIGSTYTPYTPYTAASGVNPYLSYVPIPVAANATSILASGPTAATSNVTTTTTSTPAVGTAASTASSFSPLPSKPATSVGTGASTNPSAPMAALSPFTSLIPSVIPTALPSTSSTQMSQAIQPLKQSRKVGKTYLVHSLSLTDAPPIAPPGALNEKTSSQSLKGKDKPFETKKGGVAPSDPNAPPLPSWQQTMNAVFGTHVNWEEVKVYAPNAVFSQTSSGSAPTKGGRPVRPQGRPTVKCPITGAEAKYMDPNTGVPYRDLQAYKILKMVLGHGRNLDLQAAPSQQKHESERKEEEAQVAQSEEPSTKGGRELRAGRERDVGAQKQKLGKGKEKEKDDAETDVREPPQWSWSATLGCYVPKAIPSVIA